MKIIIDTGEISASSDEKTESSDENSNEEGKIAENTNNNNGSNSGGVNFYSANGICELMYHQNHNLFQCIKIKIIIIQIMSINDH